MALLYKQKHGLHKLINLPQAELCSVFLGANQLTVARAPV